MATEPTPAAQSANRGGNNIHAVGYMSLGVLFWSLVPLVITEGDSIEGPFLFNGMWRFGVALGLLLTLFVFYRSLLLNRKVLRSIAGSIVSWAFFWTVINGFEYALFAWSVRFLDVSVAAALFETWPVFFILIMARFLPERDYHRNLQVLLPFLSIAVLGSSLVIFSQTGGLATFDGASLSGIIFGVFLVMLAVAAASFAAFTFVWGGSWLRKCLLKE